MASGAGPFRTDEIDFAFEHEDTDGTAPAAVNEPMGLIKGGVVLPDPAFDWDMFYGVGRIGRGRQNAHQGPQRFSGSVANIHVLFDASREILKMCLGELTQDHVALAGTNPGVITAISTTTLTDSGENFNSGGLNVKDDNYAVFSGESHGYVGDESDEAGATVLAIWPTPARTGTRGWIGPQPSVGDEYEVRQVESVGTSSGDKFLVPTQKLNTMTWAARFRGTHGEANVVRNYLGGKVNRATLSARAGERLVLTLDEVLFRDMEHDVALPSSSVAKYNASVITPSATQPTEEPLKFSQGTLNLFESGNAFARINEFRLTIDNQLTEQRYLSRATVSGSPQVAQIPYELIEGQRIITLEIEAFMDNREYLEHLMREGQNDALSAKTGFNFRLQFDNDINAAEKLIIQGPASLDPTLVNSTTGNNAALDGAGPWAATDNVGLVIREAPHSIPAETEALVTVRLVMDAPSITFWFDDA